MKNTVRRETPKNPRKDSNTCVVPGFLLSSGAASMRTENNEPSPKEDT